MILSDSEIIRQVTRSGMIKPFVSEKTLAHGMSYGLSCCGYDVRIAETVRLPPHGFQLSVIEEHLNVPPFLCVMVKDKSTWARRGLSLYNTIIEPGWRGYLTIEMVNHRGEMLHIQKGTPIAQLVFVKIIGEVECPYTGKYQDQPKQATPAIFEDIGE